MLVGFKKYCYKHLYQGCHNYAYSEKAYAVGISPSLKHPEGTNVRNMQTQNIQKQKVKVFLPALITFFVHIFPSIYLFLFRWSYNFLYNTLHKYYTSNSVSIQLNNSTNNVIKYGINTKLWRIIGLIFHTLFIVNFLKRDCYFINNSPKKQ